MTREQSKSLYEKVRQLLWEEWDPIGVNWQRYPNSEHLKDWPNDEYDSYAETICRYLIEGRDELALVNHLEEIQQNSMGLSSIDLENDSRVARLLLSLV